MKTKKMTNNQKKVFFLRAKETLIKGIIKSKNCLLEKHLVFVNKNEVKEEIKILENSLEEVKLLRKEIE